MFPKEVGTVLQLVVPDEVHRMFKYLFRSCSIQEQCRDDAVVFLHELLRGGIIDKCCQRFTEDLGWSITTIINCLLYQHRITVRLNRGIIQILEFLIDKVMPERLRSKL